MSNPPPRAPSGRPKKHFRRNPPGPKPPASASMSTSVVEAVPEGGSGSVRFADVPGLSKNLLAGIPYEYCTEVQAETLPIILAGQDVLAQAKTGTGKTLAFLIPAIQRLLQNPNRAPGKISIFIIAPTRELAQQISVEAEMLLTRLGGRYGVMTAVGGTNINPNINRLKRGDVDVLVATPGRVVDLITSADLRERLSNLTTFIMDEADRLLDQGFQRDLEKIVAALPNPKVHPRQTLLFSATFSPAVMAIAKKAMKPDAQFVSTLKEDDVNAHEHVKQEVVIVPHHEVLPATLLALRREADKSERYKVMVFLPTARSAALYHDLFSQVGEFPSWEIHSRMSQPARTKTTNNFRDAKKGVLFSSDVTARGIDIKDVTAVIQVGTPQSSEQYIHRLGRTARAGAEGHGVLILFPAEESFLKDKIMRGLTLHRIEAGTADEMLQSRSQIDQAMDKVDNESKEQAYRAWLGYYKMSTKAMQWDAARLVREANDWSRDVLRYGSTPPTIEAKTVGKMGLKDVPGLNKVRSAPTPSRQPRRAA